MYKDKNKQRQTQRERQRRYRAWKAGVTQGVTSEGVTPDVIPSRLHLSVKTYADQPAWRGPLTKEKQVSQKGYND